MPGTDDQGHSYTFTISKAGFLHTDLVINEEALLEKIRGDMRVTWHEYWDNGNDRSGAIMAQRARA